MTQKPLELEDIVGVGPATASKLREAGLLSVEAIAVIPVRELVDKAGISSDAALKISQAARQLIKVDYMTARELWNRRQSMMRITTGAKSLDELFGGGIETQAITEFVGEFAAGKSQLSMKLSVTVQLPPSMGGLDGKALFIDSEGTFAPQRIHQIAQAMELDPEKILDGIIYARAHNSDHQALIADSAFKICQEENIKLIVVDSILSHFRSEYIGRENLSERQQKLNMHLHKLLRLAEALNLAVVVTNQVQARPDAFFGDPNKPAGGNVMAHASTHRILMRKSQGKLRVAKILDSPYLPESEAYFMISEKGIEDAQPKEKTKRDE